MKKRFLMALIVALSVIVLASCKKNNEFISSKSLERITFTVTVAQEDGAQKEYVIKRQGNAYSYTMNKNTEYFYDFGDQTYQITSTNDIVTSTKSDRDFSAIFDAFKEVKESDLDKNSDGSYSFKAGNDPKVYSLFMEDVLLDSRTKLKEGYDAGLISIDSTKIFVKNGVVTVLNLFIKYNGKNVGLTISSKDVNVTTVNMPTESANGKNYELRVDSKNALVTLKFDNYGTIKFELFGFSEEDTQNIVNYFVYLFKKGKYSKAWLKSISDGKILVDSSNAVESTIKAPSKSTESNSRGTIAMMLLNDSDVSTQAFVINTKANASNDSSYIVIGGIVEGFDTLDKLAQLKIDENTEIGVKVSIKYNKYKYTKPELQ